MPVVPTKEMFKKAYSGWYAMSARSVNDMEIIRRIAAAVKEEKSPNPIWYKKIIRSRDRMVVKNRLVKILGSDNKI